MSKGLLLGVVLSCLGAAIGAGIWAAVAYFTGYEIGWIAAIIGGLAGLGMMLGVRDDAGIYTGVLACGIALAAIAGGKYLAIHFEAEKAIAVIRDNMRLTDDDVISYIADQVVEQERAAGKTITVNEDEVGEKSYPAEIWTDALDRWHEMDNQAQQDYRSQVEGYYKGTFEQSMTKVKEDVFASSFSFFDILWGIIAVGAAFKLGAGMNDD